MKTFYHCISKAISYSFKEKVKIALSYIVLAKNTTTLTIYQILCVINDYMTKYVVKGCLLLMDCFIVEAF